LVDEPNEERVMSIIGPYLKVSELKAGAEATAKGDGLKVPLPGVAADAHAMDAKAFEANRKLADKIRQAVAELKECDGKVPRFVWGFRMYPNAESKYWDEKKKEADHRCGCSCGAACSCCKTPSTASARKRTEKKRSAPRPSGKASKKRR
jgi:hypothetical protein